MGNMGNRESVERNTKTWLPLELGLVASGYCGKATLREMMVAGESSSDCLAPHQCKTAAIREAIVFVRPLFKDLPGVSLQRRSYPKHCDNFGSLQGFAKSYCNGMAAVCTE